MEAQQKEIMLKGQGKEECEIKETKFGVKGLGNKGECHLQTCCLSQVGL